MLANRGANVSFSGLLNFEHPSVLLFCLSLPMKREQYRWVFAEITYIWALGAGSQNQLSELKVKVYTCSRNLFQVPIYFNSVKIQ